MEYDELQRVYGREEYYWGTEPNDFARRAAERAPDRERVRAVDVGAGEGRDAVFLAEQGFDVTAIDVAPNGLAKAERLAADRDVPLDTRVGDVNDLALADPVDLVYSIGTLQYVVPGNRARQFRRFRDATTPGGVHAAWAFVDHPDVPPAPDWTEDEHLYGPGELRGYYEDWTVLTERTVVFEDDSAGVPHRHAATEVVARKPVER